MDFITLFNEIIDPIKGDGRAPVDNEEDSHGWISIRPLVFQITPVTVPVITIALPDTPSSAHDRQGVDEHSNHVFKIKLLLYEAKRYLSHFPQTGGV